MKLEPRNRLSLSIVALLVLVPLGFAWTAAATGAADRRVGERRTGPELVSELHELLQRINLEGNTDLATQQRLFAVAKQDPRTVAVLIDAYHPAFDAVREAEGYELARIEEALTIIGLSGRVLMVFDPWLDSDDPALRARAERIMRRQDASTPGGQHFFLIQLRTASNVARMQRHFLLRLLRAWPQLQPSAPVLLKVLERADPDVHLPGLAALCQIAARGPRFRVPRNREALRREVLPLLPMLEATLADPASVLVASRLMVDAGLEGQRRVLAFAVRAPIAQQVEIASDFAGSPWFEAIRQGDDRTWFDDLAEALLVPALERGSGANRQRCFEVIGMLRTVPAPTVEPLAALMGDGDPVAGKAAFEILLWRAPPHPAVVRRVVRTIGGASGDEDAGALLYAIRRTPLRLHEDVVAAAIAASRRPSAKLRYTAVRFLRACAPGRAERISAALVACLADESEDVVLLAADALAQYATTTQGHAFWAERATGVEAVLARHPEPGVIRDQLREALEAMK